MQKLVLCTHLVVILFSHQAQCSFDRFGHVAPKQIVAAALNLAAQSDFKKEEAEGDLDSSLPVPAQNSEERKSFGHKYVTLLPVGLEYLEVKGKDKCLTSEKIWGDNKQLLPVGLECLEGEGKDKCLTSEKIWGDANALSRQRLFPKESSCESFIPKHLGANDDLLQWDLLYPEDLYPIGKDPYVSFFYHHSFDSFVKDHSSSTQLGVKELRDLKKIEGNFLNNRRRLIRLDLTPLEKVTKIEDYFLCGCLNMMEVHLPPNLKSVGVQFLSGCTALKKLDLTTMKYLQKLEDGFLYRCSNIEELHLPPNLQSTEKDFLYDCIRLKTLTINKRLFNSLGGSDYFNKQKFPKLVSISFYPESETESSMMQQNKKQN